MDPKTLPALERTLYNNIKNQYTVTFEPLKIREHKLQLLKITDLEQILGGKDPLKDVSTFPFWIRLWESAIVLSEFIAGQQHAEGATLLELGAGLGAPGLTAAAAGFQVTLSDYEPMILDFERINAAASNLDNVQFAMLDWLNPPEMVQYDVIVGAEILFREEFFEPLLGVLRRALKPEGVVYLAHDIKRRSLEPFLKLAEKEYHVSASPRKLRSLDEDKVILLNRLQPRR
ncbi:MAG: methyltransferase domain-containing protein [Desulfobulbaceae bacterium]|jgi:predicted nicotinamide N-methyase|nr:methyltransferase domain-containing protein [Desulfobulbaceae bacterium]